MSQNLVKLLIGIFATMLLGYLLRPCYNLIKPQPVAVAPVQTPDTAPAEEQENEDLAIPGEEDSAPVVVHTGKYREGISAAEMED